MNLKVSLGYVCVLLSMSVALACASALADDAKPKVDSKTDTKPAATPDPKPEFKSSVGGLAVGGVFTGDTGPLGGTSEAFTLGGASSGIRSFAGQKLLLQWDTSGGARFGNGYNGMFAGIQGDVGLEFGVRPYNFSGCWSPYAGVGGEVSANPEYSFSQPILKNYIENLAGTNGTSITGSGRVSLGLSCLSGDHSLLIYGFGQAAYRGPTAALYPLKPNDYIEGGAGVRYDNHNLSLILETVYGVTQSSDPYADKGERFGVTAKVRYKLPKKWALEVVSDVTDAKVTPAGAPSWPSSVNGTVKLGIIKTF